MQQRVSDLPASEFFGQIADPDVFSGGGSVAAVTAAGAASTALLVMRLNARRRSNAPLRNDIEHAIEETLATIDAFYADADQDIAILGDLLNAQRTMKESGDASAYITALTRAAESPLQMAERIATLLTTIESQLAISTRFTVSDLGAAAGLAAGACRAALLTARVNIALLAELDSIDQQLIRRLRERMQHVDTLVAERAQSIEARAREMLEGQRPAEERR